MTSSPEQRSRDGTAAVRRAGAARRALLYLVLFAGAVAFIAPFYFVVNASLKTDAEVRAGHFIAPPRSLGDLRWSNYPRALDAAHMNFRPALANTVVITTLCVVGQILSCSLVGFGFARMRFRGRSTLFMLMLSTTMLPAQVTLIPVFVLFRALGMIDTFWPLIVPAWLGSPLFVFMYRQFFRQIPGELIEAARVDGCGHLRIYWRILMPLCGPVHAIVAIYTFLGAWNDFMGPLIYLDSMQNRTLSLALNAFKGQFGFTDVQLLMAASVVCMAPCVLLFFAAQRYFVESIAMTGIKA
ncbi:MAG TPA: carbohydrate ABC transporter permease [Polyangiaceae bacterium]|nr:carbohydrate ABC transporter permease [Polyangiaceae bacterium]